MWIKIALFVIGGLCAGSFLAAGFFALITSVGLVNVYASKTRSATYVKAYETAIVIGATLGNLVWMLDIDFYWMPYHTKLFLLGLDGLIYGIFIGTLIMAIAESIKGIPIFMRRVRLKDYVNWIVLSMAVGKFIGNLIFSFLGF